MDDPEVKAIGDVTKALTSLTDEQRRNVLLYLNARYGGQVGQVRRPPVSTEPQPGVSATSEFTDIGHFFDAADPKTEAERVLAVAYWLTAAEGEPEFESLPVNRHLKNLGHPVSNITRAFDSLISQSPRLVLQVSKSGGAKQARKRYKVTREGVKRVKAMLAQDSGDVDGN